LDAAKFNQCVDSDKYASAVQADIAEATRLGLRGTPSFFLNDQPPQVRSYDFSEFARVIDLLLK
jgi:protein-disulfide isomerase